MRLCLMKSRGSVAPHVIADIAEAFSSLGHEVFVLDMAAEGLYSSNDSGEKAPKAAEIIKKLVDFKPDFALSYGFGGIISLGGDEDNLFEALKTPYLLLFYDSPLDLGPQLERLRGSSLLHGLCWDGNYVRWLEERGVKRVFKQPLGTNVRVFGSPKRPESPANALTFVGSLPEGVLEKGLPGTPPLQRFAWNFIEAKLRAPCKPFRILWRSCENALPEAERAPFSEFAKSNGFERYKADVMALGDALYRRESIKALLDYRPSVYGGGAWRTLADVKGLEIRDAIPYGEALAALYASSAINLNLTNSHLETAVNQRPLDCAATGSFMISDYRSQLSELFDPETEIPSFKTLPEMRELFDRYSRDVFARLKMAEAARKRVLACHSWTRRAEELTVRLKAWL